MSSAPMPLLNQPTLAPEQALALGQASWRKRSPAPARQRDTGRVPRDHGADSTSQHQEQVTPEIFSTLNMTSWWSLRKGCPPAGSPSRHDRYRLAFSFHVVGVGVRASRSARCLMVRSIFRSITHEPGSMTG